MLSKQIHRIGVLVRSCRKFSLSLTSPLHLSAYSLGTTPLLETHRCLGPCFHSKRYVLNFVSWRLVLGGRTKEIIDQDPFDLGDKQALERQRKGVDLVGQGSQTRRGSGRRRGSQEGCCCSWLQLDATKSTLAARVVAAFLLHFLHCRLLQRVFPPLFYFWIPPPNIRPPFLLLYSAFMCYACYPSEVSACSADCVFQCQRVRPRPRSPDIFSLSLSVPFPILQYLSSRQNALGSVALIIFRWELSCRSQPPYFVTAE
jgi:hypothetical protein